MLIPSWTWAYELRMRDGLKAVASKEVNKRTFPSTSGCVWWPPYPTVSGPGGGQAPAEPSLAAPTSLLLAKAGARCAHWALAAKVSAQLPPSCHSRWLLQLGKAAGDGHQPGLGAGRRRMKQQQGKGVEHNDFFFFFFYKGDSCAASLH